MPDPSTSSLVKTLVALDNQVDMARFLDDLCTPGELRALSERLRVAAMVQRGIPYRSIQQQTGVSTATITRVARCLSHGSGGYAVALTAQENAAALPPSAEHQQENLHGTT